MLTLPRSLRHLTDTMLTDSLIYRCFQRFPRFRLESPTYAPTGASALTATLLMSGFLFVDGITLISLMNSTSRIPFSPRVWWNWSAMEWFFKKSRRLRLRSRHLFHHRLGSPSVFPNSVRVVHLLVFRCLSHWMLCCFTPSEQVVCDTCVHFLFFFHSKSLRYPCLVCFKETMRVVL